MSASNQTSRHSLGRPGPVIWMLMISVALNGLLLGLLIASNPARKHAFPDSAPPLSIRTETVDPRRFLRTLPPQRRKEILTKAFQSLDLPADEQPRRLFARLRQAKRKAHHLLQAKTLDKQKLEAVLTEIRQTNAKLAKTGDALMLAMLDQITPEERAKALKSLRRNRKGQGKKSRPNRPKRQEQDRP